MSFLNDQFLDAMVQGYSGPRHSKSINRFLQTGQNPSSSAPATPSPVSTPNFEDQILDARQEEISLLEQQLQMQRAIAEEQVKAAQELQLQQQQQQAEFASILEAQVEAQRAATEAQQREQERANLIASRQRQRTGMDFTSLLGSLGGMTQQSFPSLLTYSATERR